MKELLDYLARQLVDDPEAVAVEQFDEEDGTVVLELSVGDGLECHLTCFTPGVPAPGAPAPSPAA
jgi:hypothetical protein